jgi:hypothetical protein
MQVWNIDEGWAPFSTSNKVNDAVVLNVRVFSEFDDPES